MSVIIDGDMIRLSGRCPAQDAETLASNLLRLRSSLIDAADCESMHSAVLQVFIAFKPTVRNPPKDAVVRELLFDAIDAIA